MNILSFFSNSGFQSLHVEPLISYDIVFALIIALYTGMYTAGSAAIYFQQELSAGASGVLVEVAVTAVNVQLAHSDNRAADIAQVLSHPEKCIRCLHKLIPALRLIRVIVMMYSSVRLSWQQTILAAL